MTKKHTWTDFTIDALATVSGAGLGFIMNDVKGALVGGGAAYEYAHNSHGKRHTVSVNRESNKRLRVNEGIKFGTNLPSNHYSMPVARGKRTRRASVLPKKHIKKYTAKKHKKGSKRTGSVRHRNGGTRKLSTVEKKQVKKIVVRAIEAPEQKGILIVSNSLTAQVKQEQQVIIGVNSGGDLLNHFSPRKFVSAASVMFNALPMVSNFVTNTYNLFPVDTKVQLISSSVKYECKNDSTLLYYVDVYVWSPAKNDSDNGINAPINSWALAYNTVTFDTNVTTVPPGQPIYQLENNPSQLSAGFRTKWHSKKMSTMVMPPGTSTSFTLTGPSQKTLDMKKYVNLPFSNISTNPVYNDFQVGMSKCVTFHVRTEALIGVSNGALQSIYPSNTGSNGFVAVYHEHYKIAAPTKTHSGSAVVAGTAPPATNMKDFLGIYDFIASPQATFSNIAVVQPENPIALGLVS